jgi:hypothetical protein
MRSKGLAFALSLSASLALPVTLALAPLKASAKDASPALVPTAAELFQSGKFAGHSKPWTENHFGHELDLSQRRPVVNLTGTVFAEKYAKPGYRLYANLFHRGKFWIVRVPERAVKNVYVQIWYFNPKIAGHDLAAHMLTRFELSPETPIEVLTEVPGAEELTALASVSESQALARLPSNVPRFLLNNVAVSAEAQWTKDDPKKAYSPFRGVRRAFMQIGRFVSMEERLVQYYESTEPVAEVRFDSRVGDLDQVLETALEKSESDGISKVYNTLNYNCTTFAFGVLQKALSLTDDRPIFSALKTLEGAYPVISRPKLTYLGGEYVGTIEEDFTLDTEKKAAKQRAGCEGLLQRAWVKQLP